MSNSTASAGDERAGRHLRHGWLAGPYLTTRLGDDLYLSPRAAAGRSANEVSPTGAYSDSFGATRWLLDGTLSGDWSNGGWSFSPKLDLSYFEERSDAYTDSLGTADVLAVLVKCRGHSVGCHGFIRRLFAKIYGIELDRRTPVGPQFVDQAFAFEKHADAASGGKRHERIFLAVRWHDRGVALADRIGIYQLSVVVKIGI